MAKEQEIVTQYQKAFLIGEYDWTGLYGGNTNLSSFLAAVEVGGLVILTGWTALTQILLRRRIISVTCLGTSW